MLSKIPRMFNQLLLKENVTILAFLTIRCLSQKLDYITVGGMLDGSSTHAGLSKLGRNIHPAHNTRLMRWMA